jgi:hypothetical protein
MKTTIPSGFQTKMIQQARDLLKPTPVKQGHVPNWFRILLMREFGCDDGQTYGSSVLYHAANSLTHTSWLDHWGSTRYRRLQAFTSEPYNLDENDIKAIAEIARRCDCHWFLDANSWWYPGSTIRVVLYPSAIDLIRVPDVG